MSSNETLLAELTAEHRRLDEQVQALERRRALTPAEQVEMSRLKKQKLLTKATQERRRSSPGSELD